MVHGGAVCPCGAVGGNGSAGRLGALAALAAVGLRRHWKSLVALGVLAGLTGAAVLGVVLGAALIAAVPTRRARNVRPAEVLRQE